MASPPQPADDGAQGVTRGRRLGRYVLHYELATGGMATVYLARAEGPAGFQKLVALKTIHPHLAKEQAFVDMFLDEARIAARITHANVCSVFDFGQEGDVYYIAMDYLVGETVSRLTRLLSQRADVASSPRIPTLLARIGEDACEGLHAAHELRGDDGKLLRVVHRDVTPQNLFLGFDGVVRVVDFGVASAVGRVHQTTTGTLKGKFGYMSPEQVHNQPIDRRSDVFSLGTVLWEMLTRKRLFKREGEFETLRAVTEEPIPPPSKVRPGIPSELDEILLRALARDVGKRWPTARDMGRALGGFVARSGGAGVADLADLMETLFPGEHEQRRQALEHVRRVPDVPSTSQVAPAPPGVARPSSHSQSMPSRSAIAMRPSRRRRLPFAAAAGLLVVAVGTFAGAWLAGSRGDGETGTGFATGSEHSEPERDSARGESEGDREPGATRRSGRTTAGAGERAQQTATATATGTETGGTDTETETGTGSEPERDSARGESEGDREPGAARPSARPTAGAGDRTERAATGTGTRTRAAVETGTVNVVTPPGWADIYVGSRRVGRSPAEINLPAGRQRLRIVPYGDQAARVRTVDVPAGGVARVVVRIE